jgi:hypothetical protein
VLSIGMVLLISIFDNKLVFIVGSIIIAMEIVVICLREVCLSCRSSSS